MHTNDAAPALFETPANSAGYGLSAIEKSVFDSIEAIRAERGIPASRAFLAQTAMELARNIHKGNMKGRAVAHESAQLVATLEILDPVTDAGEDPDALPADLRRLIDAFASKPEAPALPSDDGEALPRLGATA
jgi:hypothetical protein